MGQKNASKSAISSRFDRLGPLFLAENRWARTTYLIAWSGSDEAGPGGVQVALERGSIQAEVNPAGGERWTFHAGPFEVKVTGTRFGLSWDADAEQLELVLYEGSVTVRGYAGSGTNADLAVRF